MKIESYIVLHFKSISKIEIGSKLELIAFDIHRLWTAEIGTTVLQKRLWIRVVIWDMSIWDMSMRQILKLCILSQIWNLHVKDPSLSLTAISLLWQYFSLTVIYIPGLTQSLNSRWNFEVILFNLVNTFCLMISCLHQKTYRQSFKAEVKFSTQKSYPDLHHSQGGMTFATQISPLLNFYYISTLWYCKYIIQFMR